MFEIIFCAKKGLKHKNGYAVTCNFMFSAPVRTLAHPTRAVFVKFVPKPGKILNFKGWGLRLRFMIIQKDIVT